MGRDAGLCHPLHHKGSFELAELAVSHLIGLNECDRWLVCQITLQVLSSLSKTFLWTLYQIQGFEETSHLVCKVTNDIIHNHF